MKKFILFPCLFVTQFLTAQSVNPSWQHSFGGSAREYGRTITMTDDKGFIVAAITNSSDGDVTVAHGSDDFWLIRLDAQGNLLWQKTYGGSGNDCALDVKQTADGGFIATGRSWSIDGDVTGHPVVSTQSDCWVIRTDASGNLLWQRSYGGSNDETGYSVAALPDGTAVIAGITRSADGDVPLHHGSTAFSDMWVFKIDATGNILWQKVLGGGSDDYGICVKVAADDGVIISGGSYSNDGDISSHHGTTAYADLWIVKLDENGSLQWERSLGGTEQENGSYSVTLTRNGGYLVAGGTNSSDGDVHGNAQSEDVWLVNLDGTGNIIWEKIFGGPSVELPYSVIPYREGFAVAGYTYSTTSVTGNHGQLDAWILAVAADGTFQWDQCFGGTGQESAYSICETAEGGLVFSGETTSSDGDVASIHGGQDVWIYSFDAISTDIADEGEVNPIHIFPNPTKDVVKISGLKKDDVVNLYDASGRLLTQSSSVQDELVLDLRNLDNGIYYLRTGTTDYSRIVKQ